MKTTRSLALLAGLLVAALLCGCGGGSSSKKEEKKPEVILRTEAHDTRAGQEASEQVAASIGIVKTPALSSYVNAVGQRVARNAPSGGFQYSFQIVDQDAPNAFALPGGFIYVSRGLLAMSNSEDELANVLGHEVVHVARRHAAARQSVMSTLPGIFQYAAMGQAASYGRDQEREADRLGQGLAGLAGYDPGGLEQFLNSLEYSERLHLGFSRMQGYMDSHPATRERVASAGARAKAISWAPRPGITTGPEDHLRRLEGLIVGTAAAEGVFQGSRFVHPGLGFSMNFPSGWDVINTKQAVGAMSPRRDGQVALEFQGKGDDPEVAANEYMEEYQSKGVRIENLQRVMIAGLSAVRATGRAKSPYASLSLHITWLARDGMIYRITGASIRGSLVGVFNNVARSFRPVTPAEMRAIRETRLHVVKAKGGESLAELSRRTNNAWDIQETAVMNGIFATARLSEGQLVKVTLSRPLRSAAAR